MNSGTGAVSQAGEPVGIVHGGEGYDLQVHPVSHDSVDDDKLVDLRARVHELQSKHVALLECKFAMGGPEVPSLLHKQAII